MFGLKPINIFLIQLAQPYFVEDNFNKPLTFLYKYEYPIKTINMNHRILNGYESVDQWLYDAQTMSDAQIVASAPMEVLEGASYLQATGEIDIVNQPNNAFGLASIAMGLKKAASWVVSKGGALIKKGVTVAKKIIPFIPKGKETTVKSPAHVPDLTGKTVLFKAPVTAVPTVPDDTIFGLPKMLVYGGGAFLLWKMTQGSTTRKRREKKS